MTDLHLDKIFCYPLKSAAGIELRKAQLDENGILNDRRWMLVDAQGKFLSQRTTSLLALIKTAIEEGTLWVTFPNGSQVEIPVFPEEKQPMNIQIWNDHCRALKYADNINRWFSDYLGCKCFLVIMDPSEKRGIDPGYALNNHGVNFPDGFPFLLISTASLDDLNAKSAEAVPADRFRANFIIRNTVPFEEDGWQRLKIGDILFEVSKPCARCVITTIDQFSGEKVREPLYTLAKYRKFANKIYFGQNLIHHNKGIVNAGDQIDILEYRREKPAG